MSATIQPLSLPQAAPLATGDITPRSGSFSARIGTATIATINSVVITRQDGVTMGGLDLTVVGSPTLDATGQIVTVVLNKGQVGVWYIVTFDVTTSAPETLNRAFLITVTGSLG